MDVEPWVRSSDCTTHLYKGLEHLQMLLTEGVLNQSPRIQRDDCSLLLLILIIIPSKRYYYSHVSGEELKLSVLVYLIPLIHTSRHPSVCSFTHLYIHSSNIWRSPNVRHHGRSWGCSCEKGTLSHQRGHIFLNPSPPFVNQHMGITVWTRENQFKFLCYQHH